MASIKLRSLNKTRSTFHNYDENKKAHNKNKKRSLTALGASLTEFFFVTLYFLSASCNCFSKVCYVLLLSKEIK